MTVENIARWAQRKGVDLLGTGDCLQADWLQELEENLAAAEPGLLALKPAVAERVARTLPAGLRRNLRYVLSTEVNCAPPGTPELGGIHCLIYFPTFDSARRFRTRMEPHGDLGEGRPSLLLTPAQVLQSVLDHDPACHFAPAHVFNPWYSALGTVSGGRSVAEVFGELTPRLSLIETGLTATPPMCRRIASLDRHALFSCSDAHSLDHLGRECTLLDIEPSYDALFSALENGSTRNLPGTLKFPILRTRYYLNRCGACKKSFEGRSCPVCRRPLVMGSRDRLEMIASRPAPLFPPEAPPFVQLLPLSYLLAELFEQTPRGVKVQRFQERMLAGAGHERYLLTEASHEEIAKVSLPQIAAAVLAQRAGARDFSLCVPAAEPPGKPVEQMAFDLGQP